MMKKILLTSGGFDNKKIADKFLELVNKPVNEIKVLFITTNDITCLYRRFNKSMWNSNGQPYYI